MKKIIPNNQKTIIIPCFSAYFERYVLWYVLRFVFKNPSCTLFRSFMYLKKQILLSIHNSCCRTSPVSLTPHPASKTSFLTSLSPVFSLVFPYFSLTTYPNSLLTSFGLLIHIAICTASHFCYPSL